MQSLGSHLFSMCGFLALSFFYFVERNVIAAGSIWIAFILITLLVKPLRSKLSLVLLVGGCFALSWILHGTVDWYRWPVDFLVVGVFGFLLTRFVLRVRTEKLRWSLRFSKLEWASIFIINIPAIFILLWYFRNHPEVAAQFPPLPGPEWALPLVIIAVALINGLREEFLFRGVIQPLSAVGAPVWYVVILQAMLFGFLHFWGGFPQGWLGVGLTALWGAAIAIQYSFFRSIALAWMTHSMADAIMFAIILYTRKP